MARDKKNRGAVVAEESGSSTAVADQPEDGQGAATTLAPEEPTEEELVEVPSTEVKHCFTRDCLARWKMNFRTVLMHPVTREFIAEFVDIPKGPFYFVAQAMGRSMDVDDLFGPFIQIEEKVPSAVPKINKATGEEAFPLVTEFSCSIPNIRNFDSWPKFPGTVTPEWVDSIVQHWDKGHWLGGRQRRLGRYVLTKKGVRAFHGRIFAHDLETDDRSWMNGWKYSEGSVLGMAVRRWQDQQDQYELIPMPKEDCEIMLQGVLSVAERRNKGQQLRQREEEVVGNVLDDLFADESGGGHNDGSPNRGGKRGFQGGRHGR